jgi:hypothetical protein
MKIDTFNISRSDIKAGRVLGVGMVRMSSGEGCGAPHCDCSDGYWISVGNGKVGLTARFKNEEEYNDFMRLHEAQEK